MSKEITILKLINLVYKNKAPYAILYNDEKYTFNEVVGDYKRVDWLYPLFFYRILKDKRTFKEFLNDKVKIIK